MAIVPFTTANACFASWAVAKAAPKRSAIALGKG
jgi:hypothetical protein